MARLGKAGRGGARIWGDGWTFQLSETLLGGKEMYQKKYAVKLIGMNDIIFHRDNVDFSGKLKLWQKDPGNKKVSVAGDDRTPAWTWLGCLYQDKGVVVIDADNLMAMLRDGGKKCSAAKGKGSLKAVTQSGIICNEIGWVLKVDGKTIQTAPLMALMKEPLDFEKHEATAKEAGFELFVKRARIGTQKHVRVRPRFANWTAEGTITVVDQSLNQATIQQILDYAGALCGLGDWRPSAPTPGRWGTFVAEIQEI